MNNSSYILGTDLYLVNKGGNTITDWSALAKWAHFVYLRASIGQVADGGFVDAANAAHAAGILVGAYHEMWPSLNLSWQANALKEQIAAVSFPLDLPPALAFEQQNITVKFRSVPTFPNPADIIGMQERVPGAILYTNQNGLEICKNAIDLTVQKLWFAHYLDNQSVNGETGVDDALSLLASYNIPRDQVLFIQTADALPYPPGISPDRGADYDRAVSFSIPGQPAPIPEITPIKITVQSGDPQTTLISVMQNFNNLTNSASLSVVPNPAPAPIPQPDPILAGELWSLKTLEELNPDAPKFNGSFAAIAGRSQANSITLDRGVINFIQSVNGMYLFGGVDNKKLWGWAAGPLWTTLYIKLNPLTGICSWVPILIASCSGKGMQAYRQKIRILDRKTDHQLDSGEAILVDSIPYQKNGDYSAWTPDKRPEMWLPVYAAFKNETYGMSHTFPNGQSFMFLMPLLNPASGWKQSKTAQGIGGLWVNANVLHERIAS